mmetsp:Transcript_25766/g.63388  ORF Transcript_25766/g.63388 Transcript_25766/m.63388 type:complete len:220 (+) Transcript_25766:68-727(+)|eukprot:CAMPEP_0197577658 /NCGR_PEP_ID=MMETSP1326-20131121/2204_1 /TAXON_ID=1155430 /ORGANISM="Genus nov. species nov., Strain RCC2288" /LENGTH=219 /DNA_ID=CAMNT_0043140757 /DNA_START=59 /DNA_END=718 /DNA_ORIENTATION=+
MAAAMASPALSARQTSFAGASVRVTARTGVTAARVPLRIEAKESRIGKEPVAVPKGVTYTLENNHLKVKGPKGELERLFPDTMVFVETEGQLKINRANDSKTAIEGHGLYRTLANNMMVGVSEGYTKKLKLVGVGYKANMQGTALNLNLGYSHPVLLPLPAGIQVVCVSNTEITITGYDKVEVGNFAAIVRSKRKPEPYKGKGVRYADEFVPIKEGKRK